MLLRNGIFLNTGGLLIVYKLDFDGKKSLDFADGMWLFCAA